MNHITKIMALCVLSTSLMHAVESQQPNALVRAARYIPGITKIALGSFMFITASSVNYAGIQRSGLKHIKDVTPFAEEKLMGTVLCGTMVAPIPAGLWLIKLGMQDCFNAYKNGGNSKHNDTQGSDLVLTDVLNGLDGQKTNN